MGWYVLLGFFSAFGLLSALWAALGWLLPRGEGCAFVCVGLPEEGTLRRVRWLQSLGLLWAPLIAVTEADTAPPGVEVCTGEALVSRLEWERKQFGTGNGDHPGRHQRRGVSEL